ncbi:MAG: TonB-dependent receptor plug domain-containing protein [Cyclobacteriaceae bacterium]
MADVYAQELGLLQIEVRQQKNNKAVDGASIHINPINKTFVTDKKGKVTVALPFAFYLFEVEAPGFDNFTDSFTVNADTSVVFNLSGELYLLDEVEINEEKIDPRINQEQISIEKITSEKASRLPVIGGERDLLKAVAYFPGVQNGSEGSSDNLVRGGSSDQNLYLLDNAVIYHTNHLYGFLSSFNPLIVSEIDVLKGGFPARFGGKLSSVIDARTVNPAYDHFEGEVSLGLAASSLYLNTPIIKDKLNIILAGRRSYYDAFLYLFVDKNNYEVYNFYDLNTKVSWQPSEHHSFYFSTYRDRDLYREVNNFRETGDYDTLDRKWSNRIYNFGWRAEYKKFASTLTVYHSRFNTSLRNIKITPDDFYSDTFSSHISDYTLKHHLESFISNNLQVYGGAELNLLSILGAETSYLESEFPQRINQQTLPESDLFNQNFYAGLRWKKERWFSDIGLRVSNINGDSLNVSFLEPRINLSYKPRENQSFKLSYARMSQPIHLLTNPGLGMPVDLYVPSNDQFVPGTSDQFALGFNSYYKLLGQDININIEGYYKTLNNIIEYRDGYSSHTFTSPSANNNLNLETILTQGRGRSYGIEYYLSKTSGAWQGGLSYTLSWTQHQFDELNRGNYFPANHDRRHNLALHLTHTLNDKWRMNVGWQFMTGRAITLPLYSYPAPYLGFRNGSIGLYDDVQTTLYEQRPRNSYRMKAFHALNLSFQRKISWNKIKGTLDLGLYNVYNRRNPYFYYIDTINPNIAQEGLTPSEVETQRLLKSVSIFPVVPSVSFSIRF